MAPRLQQIIGHASIETTQQYARLTDQGRGTFPDIVNAGSRPPGGLTHLRSDTAYRFAAGLALAGAFLIVWLNVAAGPIGIEDDDPANLLYVGVLAIGFIRAIFARFQPRELERFPRAEAVG